MASRKMTLVAFHTPVGSGGSWRRPGSRVEELYSLDLAIDIVRRAEESFVDAMLFADVLSFGNTGKNPDGNGYEPIVLASAAMGFTRHIGLVPTISTTFTQPYHVARYLSNIDHLSAGRAGWNIVTSRIGEENFGMSQMPSKEERYERADEFVSVVSALSAAWEPGAVINDRERGIWADTAKIHPIRHRGTHFAVEGPLHTPRSPQGRPVLFQAGQSSEGRDFSAKWADAVFTAQTELHLAQEFYADLKKRRAALGRSSESVKVLPGVSFVLGDTEAEAWERFEELVGYSGIESRIEDLSRSLGGIDLSDLTLRDSIPVSRLLDPVEVMRQDSNNRTLFHEGSTSRYINIYKPAAAGVSILKLLANAGGHRVFIGTPLAAANDMQYWFEHGASDGFILSALFMPDGLTEVFDRVLPLLRERGLVRSSYEHKTLRERIFDGESAS